MNRGTERVILWSAILILGWLAWRLSGNPGQYLLLNALHLR